MSTPAQPASKTVRLAGAAIAIALPTLVTWVYFVLLQDHPLQKLAFAAKVIQFGFPIFWVIVMLRERVLNTGLALLMGPSDDKEHHLSTRPSIVFGVLMGLAVSALMWVIYQFLPAAMLEGLITKATAKVQELGFAKPALFIGLGIFYSLVHSFLEEYYFRWFVFGQLRHLTNFTWAMVISGLAFMAHHVIILWIYFDSKPMAIFLSLSIAIGGMIWAWQYEKSKSLVGPWLSHMIVDAGIFWIGFDLLRSSGVI